MSAEPQIERRIAELGITLPTLPTAGGNYVPAKTVGNFVYLSGVVSADKDGLITGKMGAGATLEQGYAAARACALLHLAVLQRHLGTLDAIAEIVSLNGYVNAAPDFPDMPSVINGASDLLVEVFGEAGRHVRAAVGVSTLPRHVLVETQMVVRIG